MYNYLILFLILLSVSAHAKVTGGCADGTGDLLTGKVSGSYCQSQIKMNWWSAIAWCKSFGAELIDLTDDCHAGEVPGSTVSCPNLEGMGPAWTINTPKSNEAYIVNTNGMVSSHDSYSGREKSQYALCRLSK